MRDTWPGSPTQTLRSENGMGDPQHRRTTREKVAIFRACFSGLEHVYGTYDPKTGRVRQVKEPGTDRVILDHLLGRQPYGVYLLVGDRTRTLAVDFDEEDLNPPMKFVAAAKNHGLATYIERSKSKGYHVWMFFEEAGVKAAKARLVAQLILREMRTPTIEVFPKQDRLDASTSYGNFINAPLFGALVAQGGSIFIDENDANRPYPDQWELLANVQRPSESDLDRILAAHGIRSGDNRPQGKQSSPPCAVSCASFGLPPCAHQMLSEGTCIGYCECAGVKQRVCIPDEVRLAHCHVIGRPGKGKSTLIEHMVCHDIRQGHGVAVVDPHGVLVERLLALIPEEHADRVIYIDPGDPDWVPIWNPLQCRSAPGPHRIADGLVSAFKSFVDGWGDRLEHLLRHALLALAQLPGTSLLDVSDLLRQRSPESEQLRSLVVKTTDSEVIRQFWAHDFKGYGRADLTPPQLKLSKLLTSGTASLMLSQTDSSFDLGEVMDTGKILLVDLSRLGTETRSILGSFFLSLLYLTTLARRRSPLADLRPFHVYCDEAHMFMTDSIEDMLAQARRHKVSLTLTNQFRRRFADRRKADALSSVGTTVILNVNASDAQNLIQGLPGLGTVDDLITLELGQEIARIGRHVVRLRTLLPLDIPEANCCALIIQRSRERYCKPTLEVQRAIRRRHERWTTPTGS